MREFLEVMNLMAMPVALVGYIVILERRLTRIQTQVEFLIEKITGQPPMQGEREKARGVWR